MATPYFLPAKFENFEIYKKYHEVIEQLARSSLPLFSTDHKGGLCILGSGLILKYQDHCFLVSAGHVLCERTEPQNNKSYIWIIAGNRSYHLNDLDSYVLYSAGSKNEQSTIDFAIIALPLHIGSFLERTGYKPIHLNECEITLSERDGFGVVGWPSNLFTRSIFYGKEFFGPLVFTTYKVQHAHLIKRINPWEIHLDATFPERGIQGQELNTLRLKGMSGGPIWSLPSLTEWLKDTDLNPRLAGITICDKNVGRHRIIIGFRIAHIWNAIKNNYGYLDSRRASSPFIITPRRKFLCRQAF
jgi:hypothetical protein